MRDGEPHRGFTLLELLIVIGMIGLLMAILVPTLSAAREQGRAAVCLSNLRSFGIGTAAYATANDDVLCSGQADARPGMNLPRSITDFAQTGIERIGWIADQVNSRSTYPGLMLCPSNPGRITQSWGRALAAPGGAAWYPPGRFRSLVEAEGYNTNYCQSWYMIHSQYDGVTRPVLNNDLMHGSIGPLRTTRMVAADPARVPLLGDAQARQNEFFDHSGQGYGLRLRETKSATDGPYWRVGPDGSYTAVGYSSAAPYGVQDWDDFGPAHRPRSGFTNKEGHSYTMGNILFGDGHVTAFEDRYKFTGGRVVNRPDGELDSWDLRNEVFDGVLSLGRRSHSVNRLE